MHELMLTAPEGLVEGVSDTLVDELGALSVSVEDADADTAGEQALFGEPGMPVDRHAWQRSSLRALFADAESAAAAGELLHRSAAFDGLLVIGLQAVPDQDWVRLTQSQFTPIPITDDFWIVPSWHERPAAARIVMQLDPGQAFGTGTHPTTRMCLRWLATHAAESASWSRVLDYGCGSGILAIGTGLLGAHGIDAVDIDAAAVEATRLNAQANHVPLRAAQPDAALGLYPLVLANILATPLKLLAPLLCGHVAEGGQLLLAGILDRQADELKSAYSPWLRLEVLDTQEGWILMGARRSLHDGEPVA